MGVNKSGISSNPSLVVKNEDIFSETNYLSTFFKINISKKS